MVTFLAFVLTASLWWTVDGRILPQTEGEFWSLCSRSCGVEETPDSEASLPRFRCSCSPSCAVYGDCCHDSPHKNASLWQQFQFACASVVGRDRYRMVSSCPSNQRSDFCKEALGHLPPVTSRTTNITYGNLFCASCNGDRDDLVTWNVELRCPSEDGEEKEEEGARIVYGLREFWKIVGRTKRLCKFHAHFDNYSLLDGLELRSCDTTDRVARCSASWTDMAVVEKCRSYKDPIYFHDRAYQNAHCAFCNYLSLEFGDCVPFHVKNSLHTELRADFSVLEFCRERGTEACIKYLLEMRKAKPYSFSHLINMNVWECIPPDCCEGQRYDYRTKRCRKIRGGR